MLETNALQVFPSWAVVGAWHTFLSMVGNFFRACLLWGVIQVVEDT
jgi:hypothetical protein